MPNQRSHTHIIVTVGDEDVSYEFAHKIKGGFKRSGNVTRVPLREKLTPAHYEQMERELLPAPQDTGG